MIDWNKWVGKPTIEMVEVEVAGLGPVKIPKSMMDDYIRERVASWDSVVWNFDKWGGPIRQYITDNYDVPDYQTIGFDSRIKGAVPSIYLRNYG